MSTHVIRYSIVAMMLIVCNDVRSVLIETSMGDLVDRITILENKTEKIKDPEKQKNIRHELALLKETYSAILEQHDDTVEALHDLKAQLREINDRMWDIEDDIRAKEANHEFDDEFIALARGVYLTNDARCAVKRSINLLVHSDIVEEKQYTKY